MPWFVTLGLCTCLSRCYRVNTPGLEFAMPYNVTVEQVVCALNKTFAAMQPKGAAIRNLHDVDQSLPEWSCNQFATTLLDEISGNQGNVPSLRYNAGSELPQSMENGSFVNISMFGEPSALHHNFNIFISGESTYVIQAFLNRSVDVVRQLDTPVFWGAWTELSNNANNEWQDAYSALFGVAPRDIFAGTLPAKWLDYQYVSPMP